MAVLLLKDVLPSAASFALQNELLSKAAERITPATEELINFPHQIKEFIEKGITPRVLAMVDFLTTIVSSVYPIYVLPNFSSESTFNILCRLAPLLADYVPIMIRDKNNCRIGTRIFEALSLTFESTIIGHTNADLEINQANKMLEFLEAFLLHADCQTRNFGLETMRMIGIPYSTFWKRSDAVDVLRCRLKNCLCKLLEDSSINVAKAACRELSYALKYNMIGYDEEWFRELKEQIRTNETKPEQETEEDILRRRGGVLGLRSIIQAHASNVPDYLPEVITEVAKHAGDPEPIGQIATETMDMYYYSVFRFLTLWDRRKFSAKQHEIIESFISREK
ncbi:unnamed protein product [Hymenolepis diminuta]|uniref:DUF3437 domain-containing protein n=1 Tax=Hymenolepis diminuta TaxID=6216 RepID=A0A0R3SL19_HYMDI|nr:unnamed protein product [Hymenolepis diminuta]